MGRSWWLLLLVVALPGVRVSGQPPAPVPEPRGSFAEPAISPDRTEIAFVSGGDIWTVPAAGGDARLLVANQADESRPLYAPDGATLAFVSDRTGGGDIYLLTLASGVVRQLTFDAGLDRLDGWSRDGAWIYFSSSSGDISGMNDLYRVRAAGGTPMPVSADRYTSEFFAAPSPDGARVVFSARGNSAAQWWRNGHSHLDESELWLLHDGPQPRYEQLTERGAKQMWPMWMPDGRSIYYVSDRSGAQNLWTLPLGGSPRQVTRFEDGRVLWPTIAYDGREIVFERDFAIWKLDTASGAAAVVPIVTRGVPSAPPLEHLSLTSQFQDLALSPDGRKAAFTARGEVWAVAARDGGDAFRVTRTAARESQLAWLPDSRRLAYLSERDGASHIFLYDFSSGLESKLTGDRLGDAALNVAPDGRSLAFVRDGRELRLLDLMSRKETLLASGYLSRSDRAVAWSPDSRWVAYVGVSAKSFRNVFVVPAAGGESRPVTALPNGNTGNLTWSPDGTFLVFNTSQRTEDGQAVRVDLLLRTPRFREDRFRDLFKDEPARPLPPTEPEVSPEPGPDPAPEPVAPPPAAPAPEPASEPSTARPPGSARRTPPRPVEIVFDGIRQRASLLTTGLDVTTQTISPDGRTLLLTAQTAGQQNLYTYSLDELAREPAVARQLTSTPGPKSGAQFSPDGREVFFLQQGRLTVIPIASRQARPVTVSAELDIRFDTQKLEVFRQAWTYMRDGFYDERFHGVDWDGVRGRYEPQIAGARTPDEMRRLLNLMVGELNASHMGVRGGGSGGGAPVAGRLGLRFARSAFERDGRFVVEEVIPLGPAAVAGGLAPGDTVRAVDGEPLAADSNLDERLLHGADHRVILSVSTDNGAVREVAVRPVSLGAEKNLLYRAWVESNRIYVEQASGGRLGYVHMNDMSEDALGRLYLDLDADNRQKDGVVIDVRNNNGGFVNAYALDVLARRGYMMMTPRGMPQAPARSVLGQRALELPTILVTNQHSLSDAEDFTEGYRTLQLGKVVGEPTSGWIIYTGSQTLVDGSTIRMPGTRITDSSGRDMELHPRPVDVPVSRPIGESLSGKDSQLDAAVRELLQQLGQTSAAGR